MGLRVKIRDWRVAVIVSVLMVVCSVRLYRRRL